MAPRLFLLDTMNLVFRSYYALSGRGFSTSSGEPTSATYGVAITLLKLLREERPDYFAVLMDTAGRTFRHEKFAEYKANRPEMPQDVSVQIPRIRQVVEAMQLPILGVEGYEADDIIGTLTRRARREGVEVVIWSGDKDLLQLVGEGVTAMVPGRGIEETKTLDREGVKEKLGVLPEQVVDYLALVGDSVDGIPGVPGVGPVTAAALLARFGSVEALYAQLDSVERASLREKLRENEAGVRRNLELVSVCCDVPLEVPLEALRVVTLSRSRVMPVFREINSRRLIELAAKIAPPETGTEDPTTHVAVSPPPVTVASEETAPEVPAGTPDETGVPMAPAAGPSRIPLLGPVAFLRRARSAEGLAVVAESRRVAGGMLDIEGLALALPGGDALDISGAGLAPGSDLYDDLRATLADPRVPKWSPDLKALHRGLRRRGIEIAGSLADIDIARRMCEGIAASEDGDDETDATGVEDTEVPGESAGDLADETPAPARPRRARGDAREGQGQLDFGGGAPSFTLLDRALSIARDAPEVLRRVDAGSSAELYRRVEAPLAAVLATMEENGIAVDQEELRRLSKDMAERIRALEAEIYRLAGGPFNVNSTRQLKEVLFGKLGLSPGRRTRTGFSTDADVLTKLAREHPLPGIILKHRHLSKLRSTYAEALSSLVNPVTGRIHTTFNAMGANTGRISSRDPNLQNIPIRTEEGKAFRRVFIPSRPGWELVGADYSQIELRVLAHVTAEEGLIEAFQAGMDFHVATSSALLNIPPGEVTREIRDRAKAVNYGIIYGMGARSLAQNLEIDEKEAKRFIGSYFARYPKVERFIDGTIEGARLTGYVSTIFGRRCAFRDLHSSRGDLRSMAERAAVNAVIQGSAADIMKTALVAIDRLLRETGSPARLLLTVHDEIVLEAPAGQDMEPLMAQIAEGMRAAADLLVPLEVSVGHGADWLQAHG